MYTKQISCIRVPLSQVHTTRKTTLLLMKRLTEMKMEVGVLGLVDHLHLSIIYLFEESFAKIRERAVEEMVVSNVSRSFYLRIIKNTSISNFYKINPHHDLQPGGPQRRLRLCN